MFSSMVFEIHIYFYISAISKSVSMKISIATLAILVTLGVANPIIGLGQKDCLVEGKTCYRYGCCEGLTCIVGSLHL